MKAHYVLIATGMMWIAGCADPSGITDPIVENPKPVILPISPEHLVEGEYSNRLLGKGEEQECSLTFASKTFVPFGSASDSSWAVIDTLRRRLLYLRLSMIPLVERMRDTMELSLRRLVIEVDTTTLIRFTGQETSLLQGQVVLFLRERQAGGLIVYRPVRIVRSSPNIPPELNDSIFCTIKAWRTDHRTVVFRIVLQHFTPVELPGGRDFRRHRATMLCEVPLQR